MPTEREPEADAVLRRELPNLRAAWQLARRRGSLDHAAAMVSGLYETIAYRDLIEVRDWAEELADDPGIASHPGASTVLAAAAEAAYHRGDYRRADRRARAGLTKADGRSWHSLTVLSVVELARGAHSMVVAHSLAAAELAGEHREPLGIAALATAYAGDLEQARSLNERGLAGAASPSMRSWATYVAGEIESLAGHREVAEQRYLTAIDLARTSGATFLAGVASVGLVAVRAAAGKVRQALEGYREVVDYFARTGDWNHLWVALRNLADLLRRLGDQEPATLIYAAADQASDAPAVVGSPATGTGASPVAVALDRATVLDLARRAIERHLTGV
jgi:tetratricopeptide (TPR) repeat protein